MRLMLQRVLVATSLAFGVSAAAALSPLGAERSPSVDACTDFDEYVNGPWRGKTPMPADRGRIGSFDELRDRSRIVVEQALADALANPTRLDTPGKRLATDFYASGMDESSIERNGLAALQPLLRAIDSLDDRAQLPALLATLARHGIDAPLRVSVMPDPGDRRRYIVSIDQGGLGLPDRDDYFRTDVRTLTLRTAYHAYRLRIAELAAVNEIEAAAKGSYALQREFAASSMTRVARRDPRALYQLHTLQSIAEKAPGFDWRPFFAALGVADPGEFNVAAPVFITTVALAARDAPLVDWQAYLRQELLDHAAPVLPAAYRSAHFDYRGRAIRGLERDVPRTEHVITVLTGPFGSEPLAEGLGQLYVARAFSLQAKARALQMIEDIRAAMRERIRALDWMSDATKQRALHKLDAMTPKIGYPDRWKTYDGLVIAPDDFAGNWLRTREWGFSERLADLGRPVDRARWFASPHLVNAFAGGLNDIIFPAAILQPPFFDELADDAVNYGAIGSVIGHEITHHFDDRGRQFDSVGNLADWWTEQDAAAYRARAAKLAQQYSGYQPLPGQAINGLQTLGENISDLGGVKIAYDGLMRALVRNPVAPIDGWTPAQRFFLSYATIWRAKQRTESLLNQLRAGQHAPNRYRVLGTLANFPAFASAFACPPDAPMVRAPAEQVLIW
jgi:putative endopeptidase